MTGAGGGGSARPLIVKPWIVAADGITLAVRLTPKGGRDAIDGIETLADGRAVLKARVRAAASDGEANEALVRLLARAAGRSATRRHAGRGRQRAAQAPEDRRPGHYTCGGAGENLRNRVVPI